MEKKRVTYLLIGITLAMFIMYTIVVTPGFEQYVGKEKGIFYVIWQLNTFKLMLYLIFLLSFFSFYKLIILVT